MYIYKIISMVVTAFTCLRCKYTKYYLLPDGYVRLKCRKCGSRPNTTDRFHSIPQDIIHTISTFLLGDVVGETWQFLQLTISGQFEKYNAFLNTNGQIRNMSLFNDFHNRWTKRFLKSAYQRPLTIFSNVLSTIRPVNKQFDAANKHVFEETLDDIQMANQGILNDIQHRVALISKP